MPPSAASWRQQARGGARAHATDDAAPLVPSCAPRLPLDAALGRPQAAVSHDLRARTSRRCARLHDTLQRPLCTRCPGSRDFVGPALLPCCPHSYSRAKSVPRASAGAARRAWSTSDAARCRRQQLLAAPAQWRVCRALSRWPFRAEPSRWTSSGRRAATVCSQKLAGWGLLLRLAPAAVPCSVCMPISGLEQRRSRRADAATPDGALPTGLPGTVLLRQRRGCGRARRRRRTGGAFTRAP